MRTNVKKIYRSASIIPWNAKKEGSLRAASLFVLAALALGALVLFGISAIQPVTKWMCKGEILRFQEDLSKAVEVVSSNYGRSDSKGLPVPCSVDRVYIFNRSKSIPLEAFNHTGVLYESIKSKSLDNVFLFRGDKLLDTFFLDSIDMPFPNYLCFNTKKSPLYIQLKGGNQVALITHQPKMRLTSHDCTNYTTPHIFLVLPESEEVEAIMEEMATNETIWDFIGLDPETVQSLIDASSPYFEIQRHIKYFKEDNKTRVRIHIINHGRELQGFVYVEQILKNCISQLSEAGFLVTDDGQSDDFKRLNHPLVMWKFDQIDEQTERNIQYEVNGNRVDCLSFVNALGFATRVR